MNTEAPDAAAADRMSEIIARNERYVATEHTGFRPIAPALRTIVVGCVDPRVDPARVLGLVNGEAVVIRNVAGRITPNFFREMMMLRLVAQADGDTPGDGWNFVVLHHTDCGITRLGDHPDLLAGYFGVEHDHLGDVHVSDPYLSVRHDVETLRSNPFFPSEFTVSGLVYDVATGVIDVVVPPERLRP